MCSRRWASATASIGAWRNGCANVPGSGRGLCRSHENTACRLGELGTYPFVNTAARELGDDAVALRAASLRKGVETQQRRLAERRARVLMELGQGDGVSRCFNPEGCWNTTIRTRGLCESCYTKARKTRTLHAMAMPLPSGRPDFTETELPAVDPYEAAIDRIVLGADPPPTKPTHLGVMEALELLKRTPVPETDAPPEYAPWACSSSMRNTPPEVPAMSDTASTRADKAAALRRRMSALATLESLPTVDQLVQVPAGADDATIAAVREAVATALARRAADLEALAFEGMVA